MNDDLGPVATEQRKRLRRPLFGLGAAVMGGVAGWYLFEAGAIAASARTFVWLVVAMVAGSAVVTLVIATGRTRHLADPSLTLAQILWGTAWVAVWSYLLDEQRHIVLLLFLFAIGFGAFRLRTGQLGFIAITAAGAHGAAVLLAAAHRPWLELTSFDALTFAVFAAVVLGFALLGGDISRLRATLSARNRELEKLREVADSANRAKNDFLGAMSHELRTPLNAVLGLSEIVPDDRLSANEKHYLDTARRAGEHLVSLIDSMMDLARAEAGNITLVEGPFDLRSSIAEVQCMLDNNARERGLVLRCECADSVPARVVGDPIRLRAILVQLIGNALKFTGAGSITVRVAPAAAEGTEMLEFSVADTGIGIDAHHAEALFSPFYQVDSGRTRRGGGLGVGLAICKQIVARMGGRIWVESVPQCGSTFRFTARLPVAPEAAPAARPSAPAGPLDVLLVDDSEDNRLLMRALLGQAGHRVEEAVDGSAGLDAFKQRSFGLVLMDIHMPVMDGVAATRAIRDWERGGTPQRATPILALTADQRLGRGEGQDAALFDGHLLKPVSRAMLLKAVAECTSRPEPGPRTGTIASNGKVEAGSAAV